MADNGKFLRRRRILGATALLMTGAGTTSIAIGRPVNQQPKVVITNATTVTPVVSETGFVLTLREMFRFIALGAYMHPWLAPREYSDFVYSAFSYAYQIGLSWHRSEIAAMAEDFWFSPEVASELGRVGENIGKGNLKFNSRPFHNAAEFVEACDSRCWWGAYFSSKSEDDSAYPDLTSYFSQVGILSDEG